jgi:hypothetical protein
VNSSEDESTLTETWRTDPISVDAATTTLPEHDLAKWIKRFRPLAQVFQVALAHERPAETRSSTALIRI